VYCKEEFDDELHLDENDDFFCDDCGVYCEDCDEFFPKSLTEETVNDGYVCEWCREKNDDCVLCLRCEKYDLRGGLGSLWKWLRHFKDNYLFSKHNPKVKNITHKIINRSEKLWNGGRDGIIDFTQNKISEWDETRCGCEGDVVEFMCEYCAKDYILWRLNQLDDDGYDTDGCDFLGFKEANNGKN
jgi:hypothetical protein